MYAAAVHDAGEPVEVRYMAAKLLLCVEFCASVLRAQARELPAGGAPALPMPVHRTTGAAGVNLLRCTCTRRRV